MDVKICFERCRKACFLIILFKLYIDIHTVINNTIWIIAEAKKSILVCFIPGGNTSFLIFNLLLNNTNDTMSKNLANFLLPNFNSPAIGCLKWLCCRFCCCCCCCGFCCCCTFCCCCCVTATVSYWLLCLWWLIWTDWDLALGNRFSYSWLLSVNPPSWEELK